MALRFIARTVSGPRDPKWMLVLSSCKGQLSVQLFRGSDSNAEIEGLFSAKIRRYLRILWRPVLIFEDISSGLQFPPDFKAQRRANITNSDVRGLARSCE